MQRVPPPSWGLAWREGSGVGGTVAGATKGYHSMGHQMGYLRNKVRPDIQFCADVLKRFFIYKGIQPTVLTPHISTILIICSLFASESNSFHPVSRDFLPVQTVFLRFRVFMEIQGDLIPSDMDGNHSDTGRSHQKRYRLLLNQEKINQGSVFP